jgi:hypothetical protein
MRWVGRKCPTRELEARGSFQDFHRPYLDFAEEAGGPSTQCARLSSTKQLLNHRPVLDQRTRLAIGPAD